VKRGDIVIARLASGDCYVRVAHTQRGVGLVYVDLAGARGLVSRSQVSPAPKAVQP